MLELLDVAGERRLGHVERACRSAKTAAFGDRHEVAKLPQIHGFLLTSQKEIEIISNIFL
jgi:hypothetical protein